MEENKEIVPLEENNNGVLYSRELLNLDNLTEVLAKMWEDRADTNSKRVTKLWITEEQFKLFLEMMHDKYKDNKHNARCK